MAVEDADVGDLLRDDVLELELTDEGDVADFALGMQMPCGVAVLVGVAGAVLNGDAPVGRSRIGDRDTGRSEQTRDRDGEGSQSS